MFSIASCPRLETPVTSFVNYAQSNTTYRCETSVLSANKTLFIECYLETSIKCVYVLLSFCNVLFMLILELSFISIVNCILHFIVCCMCVCFTSAFKGPHRAICRTPSARSRVRNHGVACALRHRPISSCRRHDVQQWATVPSPSQHRAPGTVCRTRSVAAHLWLSSNVH